MNLDKISHTIRLKDEKIKIISSDRDFIYLVEEYMGYEAANYFYSLVKELEWYREVYDDYFK